MAIEALSERSPWEPRLLEREAEQKRLNGLIRDARRGEGGAVLIEGGAGVGKSRLLEYARARGSRTGMRTLSARASELEREFPYGVLRQLFERLVSESDERTRAILTEGPADGALAPLGLGRRAAVTPEPGGADTPFSLLYGLYWLTLNLSQSGPVLLTVDDAHWADMESRQFVAFLSLRLEGLPILLVVTARPPGDEQQEPLTWLRADRSIHRLAPGPLGPRATTELLSDALGSPAEAGFSSACRDLTGGNPFLLTELARSLAAEGVDPTIENTPAVRELVPEAINRAAAVRLARLPRSARDLAYAVTTLGDGCEPRHAAKLAGMDATAAANAADALRSAEILTNERLLRFVHPVVRSAIEAQLPPGLRSREHQRAAALLREEGAPAERIAIHLLATEPAADPHVVRTLYDAARRAHEQGAGAPAVAYLLRALREPARGKARGDGLELLVAAGLRAGALAVLARMSDELIDELGTSPDRLMRCGEDLAMCLLVSRKLDDGRKIAERAIDAADRAGNFALAVALDANLAFYTQLPPAVAWDRFRRYEGRLADGSPEQRLVLALEAFWGSLLGRPAAEAGRQARRALADGRIFEEQRHQTPAAQAIMALARADELDAAETAAEDMIAFAEARGAIAVLATGWHLRGFVSYCRGELRSAEADVRQTMDAARLYEIGGLGPTVWHMLLIAALVDRDECEAAEHELALSGMAGEVPDVYWFVPVLFTRAKLRLAQGQAQDAAADLLELRDRLARWGMDGNPLCPAATYAARAMSVVGEHERAHELAEEGLAHARRWGAGSMIAEALAGLGIVTGGESGIRFLQEAVEQAERTPARLVHATALTELGAALRREGRPDSAREPLRAGLELARRCGAVTLARQAADELHTTGVRTPRYMPIGVEALTPSEQRVAELAARGMTNREIAATLYVTIKTVESHLYAAFDKLGIGSRQELRVALTSEPRSAASRAV